MNDDNSTLKFLGNDSGFGEKNNSAYYEKDDNFILIDCGFTVFQQLKEKFDFNKYKEINIIITHLHNDHAGSLSQFVLYMWFIYHKKVTIFSKCKDIKLYLDITGTPPDAYDLKLKGEDLEFIKTQHSPYIDCYGFRIVLDNKKIIYTGDTSTIETFLPYLDDCNELYIDLSTNGGIHINVNDCLDLLKKFKPNGTNIIPMHLDKKEYIYNILDENNIIS